RSPWALLATRCPLSCVSEYRRRSALLCFFFFLVRLPPRSTLFPYHDALPICEKRAANGGDGGRPARGRDYDSAARRWRRSLVQIDRKSTRLNSSHGSISYAVFCLKKKNRTTQSSHAHTNAPKNDFRRRPRPIT